MSLSLRIKVPAKVTSEMSENLEPFLRRKHSKRAVFSSEDEDDMEPSASASSPPSKRPRLEEDDEEEFINVDVDDDDQDARYKRSIVKPKRFGDDEDDPPTATAKKKNKNRNKTKKVELSESEDNFEPDEEDLVQDLGTLNDGEEEEEFEDLPKRSSKQKPKGGGGRAHIQKAKGGKDKDTTQPSKKSNVKQKLQTTSPLVTVDDSNSPLGPSTSTSQDVTTATGSISPQPVTRKRKLPQIKKNKSNALGTPVAAAVKSTGVGVVAVPPKLESTEIAKTPTLRNGLLPTISADLDLRNNNVYAELFGGPGASNIRSGTNKQEQRRKELDKMREEARIKRAMEARGSFALQAQMEKILQFEERFRKSNSPALYPNILGAKMREVHDQEKTRRGESSRNVPSNEQELEEGEMF